MFRREPHRCFRDDRTLEAVGEVRSVFRGRMRGGRVHDALAFFERLPLREGLDRVVVFAPV